jgi:hypothetical protein
MDLDDEDETQRAREVQDYGIEVDFDGLGDDERAVSNTCISWRCAY